MYILIGLGIVVLSLVVGYTLAGGLGLLGRSLGWAADHVQALEVATPDGRLLKVTEAVEPDLFRGLLGSGGALGGVVTAIEIGLVPLTTVFGGAITFDGAHAETVFDTWLAWTRTVPREVTSSLGMVTMPDIPVIPEPLRGRALVSVRVAMLGGVQWPVRATSTYASSPIDQTMVEQSNHYRVRQLTEALAYWIARDVS